MLPCRAPVLASYLGTDILGTKVGGGRASCQVLVTQPCPEECMQRRCRRPRRSRVEMENLLTPSARSRNTVIPDGIDRSGFCPRDRAQARAELGWPSEGQPSCLQVAPSPPRRGFGSHGRWSTWRALRYLDIELRIANVCRRAKCRFTTQRLTVFSTRQRARARPNVIKEALACNLPVLATPAGDVRELLRDVDACTVCEADSGALASALVEILQLQRRSNGREHTEHLSIDVIARRTIECYRALGFPGG